MGLQDRLAKRRQQREAAAASSEASDASSEASDASEPEAAEAEVVERQLPDKPEPKPAEKAAEDTPKSQPPAARQEQPPAAPANGLPAGMTGEWDADDVDIPRLGLTQRLGDLMKAGFEFGSFIFDKQHELAATGDPVHVVVLACRKYWQEVKDYDDDLPVTFDTLEEAKAEGFREGYTKDGCVSRAADLDMMIFLPEGTDIDTEIEFDGMKAVLARYSASKTAYSGTVKKIATQSVRGLCRPQNGGLQNALWELVSFIKDDGKYEYSVPTLRSPVAVESGDGLGAGFKAWLASEGYAPTA